MNRSQAVVVGFVVSAWLTLIAILIVQPTLYDGELQPIGPAGQPLARTAFVAAIGVLAIGTLRRWRWTFWLMLIAFAAGIVRLPLSGLQ